MKTVCRLLVRIVRGILLLLGALALLLAAVQFTPLPWRLYKRLGEFPAPATRKPTHILVMGGSGIPGESGLMRTYYGAMAAALHPDAELLVALPLGADESVASRAYLDELALRGVPPGQARLLPGGRNTREQALCLAAELGSALDTACVLIVTDPTHVRRTAGCLRRAGVPHLAALPAHPISIEDPLPRPGTDPEPPVEPESGPISAAPAGDSFLLLRYGLWNNIGYTFDALREYAALAAYRLRGWTAAEPDSGDEP